MKLKNGSIYFLGCLEFLDPLTVGCKSSFQRPVQMRKTQNIEISRLKYDNNIDGYKNITHQSNFQFNRPQTVDRRKKKTKRAQNSRAQWLTKKNRRHYQFALVPHLIPAENFQTQIPLLDKVLLPFKAERKTPRRDWRAPRALIGPLATPPRRRGIKIDARHPRTLFAAARLPDTPRLLLIMAFVLSFIA